jgi:hypothetical protein
MKSDKVKVYMKILELEEIYNFVVHHIFNTCPNLYQINRIYHFHVGT